MPTMQDIAPNAAMPARPPSGVPAAPNDSIVTAKVIAVHRTADGQKWQSELLIMDSQDAVAYANFTKARIGQTISALTGEDIAGYNTNDVIGAHVRYRGDERGGLFYASSIVKRNPEERGSTPIVQDVTPTTAMPARPPSGVPAAPNDSTVTAKVMAVHRTADGQKWQSELLIMDSQDVAGYANFTKARIGQTISALTGEDMAGYNTNDVIGAHVRYRGDERGGLFYASSIVKK